MTENIGLFLHFDDSKLADNFQEKINAEESFSDALSIADFPISGKYLALLSFNTGNIDYICIADKGRRVTTGKAQVKFSNFTSLNQLSIERVETQLEEGLRQYFTKSSQGATRKLIPEKTWQSVLEIIIQLCPNSRDDIQRLISLLKFAGYRLKGERAEKILLEREAIGFALDIFSKNSKLRTAVLEEWAPKEEYVEHIDVLSREASLRSDEGMPSFLQGLNSKYLQEESAIQHDLMNFDRPVHTHDSGVSSFSLGDRNLTIFYANKNALEVALGVDLIYYNERFESAVLVQYKLMKQENDSSGFIYRPDIQFNKELERMSRFEISNNSTRELSSDKEYRLCSGGFFFKLVQNKGLSPASGELISGMYLPKKYMEFLLRDENAVGAREGKIITYDNAPRYFNNTEFTSLVSNARVGTHGITTEKLKEIIKEFYSTGRVTLIAHETVSP